MAVGRRVTARPWRRGTTSLSLDHCDACARSRLDPVICDSGGRAVVYPSDGGRAGCTESATAPLEKEADAMAALAGHAHRVEGLQRSFERSRESSAGRLDNARMNLGADDRRMHEMTPRARRRRRRPRPRGSLNESSTRRASVRHCSSKGRARRDAAYDARSRRVRRAFVEHVIGFRPDRVQLDSRLRPARRAAQSSAHGSPESEPR